MSRCPEFLTCWLKQNLLELTLFKLWTKSYFKIFVQNLFMNFGIAILQSERMNLVLLATTNDPFVASLWFDRPNHGNSTLLKLTSQRRVIGKSAWKCVDLFPHCLDLINPYVFWGSNYQNWLSVLLSSFHAAKWKSLHLVKMLSMKQ